MSVSSDSQIQVEEEEEDEDDQIPRVRHNGMLRAEPNRQVAKRR